MIPRCPTCPRTRPGPCFVETHATRFMCEAHARGETTWDRLLTGDQQLVRVDPPAGLPVASQTPLFHRSGMIREEVRDAVNTCLYRECRTGCQLSRCWANRGEWSNGDSSRDHCARCLKGKNDAQ